MGEKLKKTNKKDTHPLKALKSHLNKILKKHFSDEKNFIQAQTTVNKILNNTSNGNEKHISNMIENVLENYNSNSKNNIQSDTNHDMR